MTMVDKLAWALVRRTAAHYGDIVPEEFDLTLSRELAQDAIKTMHQFTLPMAQAGREAFNWRGDGFDESANKLWGGDRVFHAMLEAALAEQPAT